MERLNATGCDSIKRCSSSRTTNGKIAALAGLLLFYVALGVAYLKLEAPPSQHLDSAQLARIETGRRIYALECASCHGAALEGQPNWHKRQPNGRMPAPPHDASGHTWHHDNDLLFRIIKYGPASYPAGYEPDMPAFRERLTDEQISTVLAFIKSTWPTRIRSMQNRIDADSRLAPQ